MWRLACCAAVAMLACGAVPSRADDIVDQINEGLAAYQRKDIPTAIAALNAAVTLMEQSRAESLKALLPAAPPGWTAQPPQGASSVADALMGTGASRKYVSGGASVDLSLLIGSPLIQAMSGMLGNPLVASLAGRTLVVSGRRVIYRDDDNSYTALIANRVLARIVGSPGVPETTLKLFLQALPFDAIERAAQ